MPSHDCPPLQPCCVAWVEFLKPVRLPSSLLSSDKHLDMNNATGASTYRLRTELLGHASDVRGVACSSSGQIATASRDKLVKLWDLSAASTPLRTLTGHSHWVNDVLFLESGRMASACADGTVRIWDTSSGEVVLDISAHKQAACGLSTDGSRLVSSSWDKSARVWDARSGAQLQSCGPHDAAVWAALPLPGGQVVTVAADKSVRLWPRPGGKSVVLSSAHTDVVRGVTHAPLGGFATVSNDSSLVYWRPTAGGVYAPMGGVSNLHDGHYIYAVTSMEKEGTWLFATAGEDNAVRVLVAEEGMQNVEFKCVQTIMHPGTVWDVVFCPNGDIVTACSDGVARVFTADPSVVADEDVLTAFQKAVSERKVSTKVIGGVDTSKLISANDLLTVPGTKDGENKIVRSADGTAEVYMWSAIEQKWTKIGDVVDDPSGGVTPGTVLGKSYDFVFDVEMGEAGPKKKLGFNRGENPYAAAQRFIDDNELNQDFLDQIANFITNQVPAEALGTATRSGSDPLTGSGRYVPGGNSGSGSTSAGGAGIGGSRHVPRGSNSGATGGDPFTGGSRYVPGGSTSATAQRTKRHIPCRTGSTLFRTSGNVDAIVKKVTESCKIVREDHGIGGLNDTELTLFSDSLVPKLRLAGTSTAGIVLEDEECALVEQMVKFPTDSVFACLDVARLAVGFPTGATYFFAKKNGEILDNVLAHARAPGAGPAVLIMACRFTCNLFANSIVANVAKENCGKILSACSGATQSPNKRARETFSALLSNYALLLHDAQANLAERSPVMAAIVKAADEEKDEGILYSLNVALGTLMSNDSASRKHGVEIGAAKLASDAAPVSSRLQEVAEEIARLIVDE